MKRGLGLIILVFLTIITSGCASNSKIISDCKAQMTHEAYTQCILNAAIQKDDLTLCDQDPGCLRVLWKQHPYEKLCQTIKTEVLKNECHYKIAILNRNSNQCDPITNPLQKQNCLTKVSKSIKTMQVCDKMTTGAEKDTCIYTSHDPTTEDCFMISNQSLATRCIMRLAQLEQDYIICDELNQQDKTACTSHVASIKGDAPKCHTLFPEEIKENCLAGAARTEIDLSSCQKMTNQANKATCTTNVAKALANTTMCQQIQETERKDNCLYQLSKTTKNEKTCEKITTPELRDRCYLELTAFTNNRNFCAEIKNIEMRKSCQ